MGKFLKIRNPTRYGFVLPVQDCPLVVFHFVEFVSTKHLIEG
jgi:hypothetical protein